MATAGGKILDETEIIRLTKANLRLLFAVDPEVGEDFALANQDVIGRAIQMPPKALQLKLHTTEDRLGEIDLIDLPNELTRIGAPKMVSESIASCLASLGPNVPNDIADGAAFLNNAEHRHRATAPARLLAREGIGMLVAMGNQGDTRQAMEKVFAAARWAEAAHAQMQITGRAASWYLGYAALMNEANGLSPDDFVENITPLFLKGGAKQTTMLAWIAHKLCAGNAGDRVALAADACLGKGMKAMGQAYQSKDLEEFQSRIYGALPNLLAAFLLAGITNVASPVNARSARSAELAILRALHTLQNAIADLQGLASLRSYQSAIAAIRAREGANEAKRMALELTDMMMLYPAICKPILVGDVRL
jgi:hypothetical protein